MAKQKNSKKKGIILIKKSNNLIESRYKFNIWETRVFLSVLGQIRKDDNEFSTYRIWYGDIIKQFGLASTHSYKFLREAAEDLMKQQFKIPYADGGEKRYKKYQIIRYIDVSGEDAPLKSQEYIDVTIEPEMKPFLLQLKKSFTAYDLRNITKLGVYSVRIYELLKQYESIGHRQLDIEAMKLMFEISTEYPKFSNFYQKVVQPSIDEINEHTDLKITRIERKKEGRKVTALMFYFTLKSEEEVHKSRNTGKYLQGTLFDISEPTAEQLNNEENGDTGSDTPASEIDQLFIQYQERVVIGFGVTPTVFLATLEGKTREDVEKAIRVTSQAHTQEKTKIENIAGFFIQALKDGFTNENEEKITRRKIQREKEKKIIRKNQLIEKLQSEFDNRQDEYHLGIYEKLPEEESLEILTAVLEKEYTIKNLYYDYKKSVIRDMGKRRVGWIKAESIGKDAQYLQGLFLHEKKTGIEELGYTLQFDDRSKILLLEKPSLI